MGQNEVSVKTKVYSSHVGTKKMVRAKCGVAKNGPLRSICSRRSLSPTGSWSPGWNTSSGWSRCSTSGCSSRTCACRCRIGRGLGWHEAQAWCRRADRRLPSEAEWECAAMTQPGFRWDWTASTFEACTGFAPHPYRDYSGTLVWHAAGAARRQSRHRAAHGASQIPQLLHARAQRHLCRLSQLRAALKRGCRPCFLLHRRYPI